MTPDSRSLFRRPTSAVFWRCRECGKWSHAQRRPLRHKRWGGTEFDLTPEQAQRVAEWSTTQENDTGAFIDVAWLWCGPFDRYEARHSDHCTPPALDTAKLPKPKDVRWSTEDKSAADPLSVPF